MRRVILLGAAGCALVAAGAAGGWLARGKPRLDATLYAQNRFAVVQQHLDEAVPGYVLLAGDSQAELHSPPGQLCGAPPVNAGLSGATVAVYAKLLATLDFPVRPRAALLTIGTNNMNRKNDPNAPETLARFERDASAIVTRLSALTERVVVTALPPLGSALADRFDGDAVGSSSQRLEAMCRRLGCIFADPFADLRDGTSGYGRPGANKNELHLARYRPILAKLEPVLCPTEAAGGP